jgi:MFS family permease
MTNWKATVHQRDIAVLRDPTAGAQLLNRRSMIGWSSVTLTGAAFAITMLGTTLPTPLYPLYEKAFGFGELVTTVVFATYAAGVITGLLLFGHWSDQVGRRPMLHAGRLIHA